ncbi:hypothetical protein ACJJTC_014409 [Scirpophaga incertulas]
MLNSRLYYVIKTRKNNFVMDSFREFVVTTTENYHNKKNLQINAAADEALSNFFHHSEILLLQSFVKNNTLVLYTTIKFDEDKSIIFYKSSALELKGENFINNINLVTLTNNATETLYQILKQIYTPLLATGNDLLSNKIQKNLFDLESNLRIITHGKDRENMNVILSIEDEVEYWKSITEKQNVHKRDSASSALYDIFQDISEELRLMETSPLQEVREIAENVGGLLDDVWRLNSVSYSEDRMIHVFNIIGHRLCSIIQKHLPVSEIWKVYEGMEENEILTLLSDSLSVIRTWIGACKSLTETYWPNYALHAWNGKPFLPNFCLNFEKRLKEIQEIRLTYCQLNKLLSAEEKMELKIKYLFEPFETINIWIYNGPNQAWDAAISKFAANLRPAEMKIAEKLKPRLHNTSTKQVHSIVDK